MLDDQHIRPAMERLLRGEPIHSDGKLTVKSLASEAGVSRQTVYNSPLLTEFKQHLERIKKRGEDPHEKHLQKIARLEKQLDQEKKRVAEYRKKRDEERAKAERYASRLRLQNDLDDAQGGDIK